MPIVPTMEPRYRVDFVNDASAYAPTWRAYVKDFGADRRCCVSRVDTLIEVRYRKECDDWFISGSCGWHNIPLPLVMESFTTLETARDAIEQHVLQNAEEYIDSDTVTRHGWPGMEDGEPPPIQAVAREYLLV